MSGIQLSRYPVISVTKVIMHLHRTLTTIIAAAAVFAAGSGDAAAMTPLWLRASAISPDGQTIVFAYKGDLYSVPAAGGSARQLTTNAAWDGYPVWSPSGRQIAFASEREGSLDVYVMAATGDGLTRLTTHSGTEVPMAFASETEVLFSAAGTPTVDDMQFPSRTYTHIYKVPTTAGARPQRVSDVTAGSLTVGPDGSLIYDAVKGYEDAMRKHHTSSIARDLWQLTLPAAQGRKGRGATARPAYRQLTESAAEDRNPVYVASTQTLYWLSEQTGTLNVWCRQLDDAARARQLTFFSDMPVRYLTAAADGTLCFSWDGELYTMRQGTQPRRVKVDIVADTNERDELRAIVANGATSVSLSPKNKEIAFVLGGDVYVTSLDYKTTRQITDNPFTERNVSFAPDGRSIVYDSERGGRWGIYRATIKSDDEKQFVYATEVTEELLTSEQETSFQPVCSPDGTRIAFLRDRQELCVLDVKTKAVTVVMPGRFEYSYRDGDQTFAWSPNSKYLLSEYIGTGGWNNTDIALIPADGKGEIVNLTNSGYSEANPRWVLGGKAFIFQSDRAGYRSHGSWGAERDLYITFLSQDAYERFLMNKEERELYDAREKEMREQERRRQVEQERKQKEKEQEDAVKAGKRKKRARKQPSEAQLAKARRKQERRMKQKEEQQAKADSIKAVNPDFDLDRLDLRTVRLTFNSSSIGDCVLSKDGTKLYYVASNYPNGSALWMRNLETGTTSVKATGVSFSEFDLDADGTTAYYASGGQIRKLAVEGGSATTVDFECFHSRHPAARRAEIFAHIWHQTREKLYDPDMNGADWLALRDRYARFLPHIAHNRDFAEMASELLGELNVSHTGCRYMGGGNAMATADLGVFADDAYTGDGLRIIELIEGTPLTRTKSVKPGTIITHIDGQPIRAGQDYYPLLAGKAGRYTRLTVVNGKGKPEDVTVRLATGSTDELYRRWVRREEHIVDSISHGRVAYVHIRAMNSESFRNLYRELLSDRNRNRDAVVVDTRHNGGGWLHNDVCQLLSGKKSMDYMPRGQYIGSDPFDRWVKPSCMLICEDNYSNAHGTPWLYKEQGIGQLIGAPVPGTMTAVWWEYIDDIVFGIPEVGAKDRRGHYLENQQLEPDVLVIAQPSDLLHGRDMQLEQAVRSLMEK